MSAPAREWVKGIGYCTPTPPTPAREPAPQPAREPVEPEPATTEPVEPLTNEQAAAKVRELMADVLDALDELKPHTYGQKISADLKWMRARARQIRRNT
jgi:hypothetical protein